MGGGSDIGSSPSERLESESGEATLWNDIGEPSAVREGVGPPVDSFLRPLAAVSGLSGDRRTLFRGLGSRVEIWGDLDGLRSTRPSMPCSASSCLTSVRIGVLAPRVEARGVSFRDDTLDTGFLWCDRFLCERAGVGGGDDRAGDGGIGVGSFGTGVCVLKAWWR